MEKLRQIVWTPAKDKWRVQIGNERNDFSDIEDAFTYLRSYLRNVGNVPTYIRNVTTNGASPSEGKNPDSKWAGEESRALSANLAAKRKSL